MEEQTISVAESDQEKRPSPGRSEWGKRQASIAHTCEKCGAVTHGNLATGKHKKVCPGPAAQAPAA